MKILNIIAQKPGNTGSGVYLNELVREFALLGHEQAVVAGITKADEESVRDAYAQMKDANGCPAPITFYPAMFGTEQLPFPVVGMSDEMPYESTRYCDLTPDMVFQFQNAFAYQINRAIEALEPDIIICHHLYLLTAIVCDVFSEQHVVGICHNTDLRQMQKNDLLPGYITRGIQHLDHIFVPRKEQYDLVQDIFHIKPEKITMLGMGYNPNIFFCKEESNKETSSTLKLCYAGKIAEKKGLFAFLHAMEKLDLSKLLGPDGKPYQNLTLTCAGGAGNAEEYQEITEFAKTLPFTITFPGKLSQIELAKLYCESDVFVLPSYYEGIPLVAIEAFACGCKVLISDLPGIQDWFKQSVSNESAVYVTLPTLVNADEPVEEELPAYEERLLQGLYEIAKKEAKKADTSRLSWHSLAERILVEIGK